MLFASLRMSWRIRETLLRRVNNCISSTFSANSFRGVKSFNEIPRASDLKEAGGQTYLHKFVDDNHKNLGPIFIAQLEGKDIVFLSDPRSCMKVYSIDGKYPKHIGVESWRLYLEETKKRRGLFFMEEAKWLESRRVFNSLMMIEYKLKNYVQNIAEISRNFIDIWKINPPTKDLKRQIYFWNVECIGEIALGRKLGFVDLLKHNKLDTRYTKGRKFVEALFNVYIESGNLMDLPVKQAKELEMESWTKFCEAMDTMLEYGEMYVQMGINDCSVEDPSENTRESLVYKALIQEKLDEKTIKDVVVDLFLGSPDSTSHTAIWALYLLGRNPDVANKAREEIVSVLNQEPLSLETLNKIPYLKGIIKETLRLYSPAPFTNRILGMDIEICDHFIPTGTIVFLSLLTMGRDPSNFSHPDEFRPERWWLSSRGKKSLEYPIHDARAHTPFSHGSRKCVGFQVAKLDLSLLLLEVLKTFEWTVEEEVEPILRLITVPSKDVILKFKPL